MLRFATRLAFLALALAATASLARAEEPLPQKSLEDRLKEAGAKEEAIETGEILAEEAAAADGEGYETRVVKLKGSDISPQMVLSPNGSMLYLADKSGSVRKIHLPSWREERRLWIGKAVTSLANCKEGLLATVPEKKQLLLIKEDTLKVLYHWTLDEAGVVFAMPSGGLIWVPKHTNGKPTELQVIEQVTHALQPAISGLAMMQKFGALEAYKRNPGSLQISTFENLTAAPKGDWLVVTSSDCIFRMRMQGSGLAIEEASSPLGRLRHLAVSQDGTLIGAAAPIPAQMPAGWPALKGSGSVVFKVKDLSKPTAVVEGLALWGFTRSAEKLFGFREDGKFVVQSAKGKIDRSIELGATSGCVAVAQGSEGLRFVIHLGDRLAWVWFK
ncbi:MAG: hypothetical protein FD180_3251 [Planctomycetota bacterium]|nr:MAG: hypothetical protein FD180_3251 [Planctomycetota bacterium]